MSSEVYVLGSRPICVLGRKFLVGKCLGVYGSVFLRLRVYNWERTTLVNLYYSISYVPNCTL